METECDKILQASKKNVNGSIETFTDKILQP